MAFTFPVWLQGSPEQQEAEAHLQSLQLSGFTRAKQTDAERLLSRGLLLEQTARGNLDLAEGSAAIALAKSQLADALAMQGRYGSAVDIHPDPVRKEHFQQIINAIEMDDEEKCDCADLTAKMSDVELAITPRFERAQVFSPVHAEMVSVVECSTCGHLNARPLRSRLLKHRDALGQNENSKRPMMSDLQLNGLK